jgi:lysophospholipase L1-like esterase
MIGTNDIKNKTSLNDFIIAYKQIIVKAKLMAVNNNIVLFKIPRFTKEVFYPYTFDMNTQVDAYNTAIEELATQNGLRTIELELDDNDFFDGVHFSAKGSNSAAEQLSNFILKDKGFESSSNLS